MAVALRYHHSSVVPQISYLCNQISDLFSFLLDWSYAVHGASNISSHHYDDQHIHGKVHTLNVCLPFTAVRIVSLWKHSLLYGLNCSCTVSVCIFTLLGSSVQQLQMCFYISAAISDWIEPLWICWSSV